MDRLYTIALVAIARDESVRIGRLLRSAAPFVDRMHVVDTGSRDETAAVSRACGATVSHLPWPDDFSVARNVSLQRAAADWHLVLDADEWIVEGGASIALLRGQAPQFVGALRFDERLDNGARAGSWMSRVFPGSLRYQGAVHEQVTHALPVRRLPVVIAHDGYMDERLQAKRGRNRRLLERALRQRPLDAYLWYQLGKDCNVYEEHALAEQAFSRAAELVVHGPTAALMPWWADLVVRRLIGLRELQRHEQAMDLAASERGRCADMPDFFFVTGDLLLDLAARQPAHGDTLLPMIETAWRHCLTLGERPDLPETVPGRGSWLAAHNLAVVMEGTGRCGEAATLRAAYPFPAASG